MSFFGDLLGKTSADAARAAAQDQYSKQTKAADATRAAGSEYLSGLMGISGNYDPYVQGGNSALQKLLSGLGLGGDASEFAEGYRNLPGYQSGLDAGSRAITGNSAARGMLNSGSTLKGLQRFGSDYEDQRSGDYLSRLMALGTQGLGATQAQTGVQAQGYGGQLNANVGAAGQMYGAAPTIGQGMVAGANAESSAIGNLLGVGGYLGGSLLGGGFGTSFGKSVFG